MTILPIKVYPDEVLREKCAPVTEFDGDLRTLVADMFATMYDAKGIGLAASQVGILKRVAVIDIPEDDEPLEHSPDTEDPARRDDPAQRDEKLGIAASNSDGSLDHGRYVLVNPRLSKVRGRTSSEEGCLSIPDYRDVVKRHDALTLDAFDEHGKAFQLEASGLLAICIQHECDHLDGILFVDHLSRLKRELFRQRFKRR